jgi:hypothetical protein
MSAGVVSSRRDAHTPIRILAAQAIFACLTWVAMEPAAARPPDTPSSRARTKAKTTQTEPPPAEAQQSSTPPRTTWYGWQTLASDGAALTLIVGGGVLASQVEQGGYVVAMGGLVYLVGAPVVHFTHERAGAGLGSLGMRAGLPLLGAAIGASAEDCSGEFLCGLAGAFIGFFVGSSAAIAIDASLLAYEEEQSFDADYARRSSTWTLVPNVTTTHAGASLVGTF